MRLIPAHAMAAVVLVASLSGTADAQSTTFHAFEGHTLIVTTPPGYKLADEASPFPGYKTFGFATDPRSDDTRGVIQVSLTDFKKIPGGGSLSLDQFVEQMVASMRRAHGDWTSTDSTIQVMGVPAKRIEWSGSIERAPGQTVDMRGLMVIGIVDDVGFRAEAQDTRQRAAETLPNGERTLRSLKILVKR